MTKRCPLLLPMAAVALASCSQPIAAPSLALRPIEKQAIDLPLANATEPDAPAEATLLAQTEAQIAAAEAADTLFVAQRARAEVALKRAAGRPQGSDAWVEAQTAITALDAMRTPIAQAASAIDDLRQSPANASPGNRAEIDRAAARIAQIDDTERAGVTALGAMLR